MGKRLSKKNSYSRFSPGKIGYIVISGEIDYYIAIFPKGNTPMEKSVIFPWGEGGGNY